VGIGTTNPQNQLHIVGPASPQLRITNNSGGDASLYFQLAGSTDWSIGSRGITGGFDIQETGLGSRIFIQNNTGRVGIGTTNPGYKLDVVGDIRAQSAWLRTTAQTGLYSDTYGIHLYPDSASYWTMTSPAGLLIRNGYAGALRGYLYADGTNFGLLPPNGSWKVRVSNSDVELYGVSYADDFRTNILYDRQNTNYYVDPSSASRFAGEVRAELNAGYGQFRAVYGGYGTIFRQDGSNFYILITNNGDPYGSFNGLRPLQIENSTGYVHFPNNHGGDIAENYFVTKKALRSSLVSIDNSAPSSIKVSSFSNKNFLGIISTVPGAVMNSEGGFSIGYKTKEEYQNEKAPVALAGNVPALVSSQNGPIEITDPIGLSSLPGFGAKSVIAGQIVGRAFEKFEPTDDICQTISSLEAINWPDDEGKNTKKPCFKLPDGTYVGKIMVAVNVGWFDPIADTLSIDSSGNIENTNAKIKALENKNNELEKRIRALEKKLIK